MVPRRGPESVTPVVESARRDGVRPSPIPVVPVLFAERSIVDGCAVEPGHGDLYKKAAVAIAPTTAPANAAMTNPQR